MYPQAKFHVYQLDGSCLFKSNISISFLFASFLLLLLGQQKNNYAAVTRDIFSTYSVKKFYSIKKKVK